MRDLRQDLKERRAELEARCVELARRHDEAEQRAQEYRETVAELERQKEAVNSLLAIAQIAGAWRSKNRRRHRRVRPSRR